MEDKKIINMSFGEWLNNSTYLIPLVLLGIITFGAGLIPAFLGLYIAYRIKKSMAKRRLK